MNTPTHSSAKDITTTNREEQKSSIAIIKWGKREYGNNPSVTTAPFIEEQQAKHIYYQLDKKTGKLVFEKEELSDEEDTITLNGRPTTMKTIDELSHPENAHPLVCAGLEKIKQDLVHYKGVFPDNYYEIFGTYMVTTALRLNEGKIGDAMEELWSTIDNKQWKHGSAIYHLYENLVRKNDNTGHDKLLHFLGSALWQCRSKGLLTEVMQYGKEIQDEIQKRLGQAKDGFDTNDIRANRRGEAFAETLEGCSIVNDVTRKAAELINNIERAVHHHVLQRRMR